MKQTQTNSIENNVRCNDCWWHGHEDDLVLAVAEDYPDDEATKVCPKCKQAGCLMDLEPSDSETSNAEQETFERAYKELLEDEMGATLFAATIEKAENGEYKNSWTAHAWKVWQLSKQFNKASDKQLQVA